MEKMLKKWMKLFHLQDWNINLERIHPEQIDYDDQSYFIGIVRDFDNKTAVIYHDIDLDEESIIHELLHIVFPSENEDETFQDYERWITEAAENLAQSEDVWKPVCNIPKMFTGFQPYHHLEALNKNEK